MRLKNRVYFNDRLRTHAEYGVVDGDRLLARIVRNGGKWIALQISSESQFGRPVSPVAKAALRQRIEDIAVGAAGFDFKQEDEFATADMLSRFIPALEAQFGYEKGEGKTRESNDWLWKCHNLHYFDNIDSTTDFLFQNEVRA